MWTKIEGKKVLGNLQATLLQSLIQIGLFFFFWLSHYWCKVVSSIMLLKIVSSPSVVIFNFSLLLSYVCSQNFFPFIGFAKHLLFFLIFIYFMIVTHKEREREAETEAEGEAGSPRGA